VSDIRDAIFDNQIGKIEINLPNERDTESVISSFDELKLGHKKQLDAVIDVAVRIAIESCNCKCSKT